MKNKIELKKMIITSIFIIIGISIIFGIMQKYEYKVYTRNFNNKINAIVEKVAEKYPDINKNDLIELLNSENNNSSNILSEYGINIENDSILIKNNKNFNMFFLINIAILVVLGISILGIFLRYNYKKDKKLKEITKYIEEINNRNYKLDIDDNTEDELSILKNELYKTTVMLKEVAENSKKDKLNLKESLSDISHQLKTPITAITVMLDNIIDNPDMENSVKQEFIKDIKREIINISFLVNTLLKLSKLDACSIKFIKQKVLAKNLIEESIKNVSILSDLKNTEIITNIEENIKINIDLKWQIEAITNILKNCIEHSKENSIIEINVTQNKVYTQIEIKDNGQGIDEEDLKHIFQRFYRGKNSNLENIGIGLALAKSIIESDNGNIDVESKIGIGTKFIIKYYV